MVVYSESWFYYLLYYMRKNILVFKNINVVCFKWGYDLIEILNVVCFIIFRKEVWFFYIIICDVYVYFSFIKWLCKRLFLKCFRDGG